MGDKVDFYHPVRDEGVHKLVGAPADQGGICHCDRDFICCFWVLVSARLQERPKPLKEEERRNLM